MGKVLQFIKGFYNQNKDKEGIYLINSLGNQLLNAGQSVS
jgi:hypothetical protein